MWLPEMWEVAIYLSVQLYGEIVLIVHSCSIA